MYDIQETDAKSAALLLEIEKEKRKLRIIIVVAILLILAATVAIIAIPVLNGSTARTVLREAKTVRLAVDVTYKACYASNIPFVDDSRISGLTEYAETEVNETSMAEGSFRVLAFDAKNGNVTALMYTSEGFTAEFTTDENGDNKWIVYKQTNYVE